MSSSSSVSSSSYKHSDYDENDWEDVEASEEDLIYKVEEPEEEEESSKKVDYLCLAKKLSEIKDQVDKSSDFKDLQKSVVIIGDTGVGKSALINLIAGKKLFTKFNEFGEPYVCVENPLENCKVSHEPHSETDAPQKWFSEKDNITYWDTPGLSDNRGVIQEYKNAIATEKLFNSSKEIKIILMLNQADITQRNGKLIYIAKLLSNIFKNNIDQIKDSISLIVSFASKTVKEDMIKKAIDNKIKDPIIFLSKDEKKLLTYLSNNVTIFNSEISHLPTNFKKYGTSTYFATPTLEDLRNRLINNINKMKFASDILPICYPVASMIMDFSSIKKAHEAEVENIKGIQKEFDAKLDSLSISEENKAALYSALAKIIVKVDEYDTIHKFIKECNDMINKYTKVDLLENIEKIDDLKTLEKFSFDAKIFSFNIKKELQTKMVNFVKSLKPKTTTTIATEDTKKEAEGAKTTTESTEERDSIKDATEIINKIEKKEIDNRKKQNRLNFIINKILSFFKMIFRKK